MSEYTDLLGISIKNNTPVSRLIKYSASILNSKSEETHTYYFDLKLDSKREWNYNCVIARKELFKNAEDLLPGGSLNLAIKVKFRDGKR